MLISVNCDCNHRQSFTFAIHNAIIRFTFLIAGSVAMCGGTSWSAIDYFVTIGGGYNPSGNQASLAANVFFFQTVLREKHRGECLHDVYFADGFDNSADVQILAPKVESKTPATDLIASLHRREAPGAAVIELKTGIMSCQTSKERAERRRTGRGPRRRTSSGRSSSGRRELLQEVTDKWPELVDEQNWSKSPLLAAENQMTLLSEIEQLPACEAFDKNRRQREEQSDKSEPSERREVKFRRLLSAMEVIFLSKNLPPVASEEIVKRFGDMLRLEASSL